MYTSHKLSNSTKKKWEIYFNNELIGWVEKHRSSRIIKNPWKGFYWDDPNCQPVCLMVDNNKMSTVLAVINHHRTKMGWQ